MEEKLYRKLKSKHLKPSYQRIKILEYLETHRCHPSADTILNELEKQIPTISKSTVYTTLKAFVEAGILHEITIDDDKVRYEYNLENHGHFKCKNCGKIFDFNLDFENIQSEDLEGFKIEEKDIYFRGICKDCLKNLTSDDKEDIK